MEFKIGDKVRLNKSDEKYKLLFDALNLKTGDEILTVVRKDKSYFTSELTYVVKYDGKLSAFGNGHYAYRFRLVNKRNHLPKWMQY